MLCRRFYVTSIYSMHTWLTDQEQNNEKLQQITVLIAYFYQINAYQISHKTYMYSFIHKC